MTKYESKFGSVRRTSSGSWAAYLPGDKRTLLGTYMKEADAMAALEKYAIKQEQEKVTASVVVPQQTKLL